MSYKDKEKEKAYQKAYRQAHREERRAYQKAYNKSHREELKAYSQTHREERSAYHKAYRQAHREELKAYSQTHREERRAYRKSDTNSFGQTKQSIRAKSSYHLFNVLKHTKLKGYEIHHCFGYNDYRNFIYIPKELHLQIHQYLRDNDIDADTDHYNKIVHLIIACEEYVYIKA